MTETVVETCADCPFMHSVDAEWCENYGCNHPQGELEMLVPGYGEGPPPDWCPLREGPVTIRLKVRS